MVHLLFFLKGLAIIRVVVYTLNNQQRCCDRRPGQAASPLLHWPFCWKETLIKDLKNDDRKSGRPPFVFALAKMMMEYLMKWHLWVLSRAQGYEKTAPQKWMHISMKRVFLYFIFLKWETLVFSKKILSNVVICRFLI